MQPSWHKVAANQWSYGCAGEKALRHIVYNPYDGTGPLEPKYVVTGEGHDGERVFATLEVAKAAAVASLK
jgi:hypothetical protein